MKGVLDVLPDLVPGAAYRAHALHGSERIWVEKNCYVDICIEVVHALGLEPLAMLGSALTIDFDGDQFTFYKPAHRDLLELYGLEVQELNVWRELIDHVSQHLAAGRLVSTETDAFWLPDTSGTDYGRQHSKTTIVISALDRAGERIRYFHNGGFHELGGADFQALFRPRADQPGRLPLYAEIFQPARGPALRSVGLLDRALALLKNAVRQAPAGDPVARLATRLEEPDAQPSAAGLEAYHQWAFATLRQLGAGAELAAAHLDWLEGLGVTDLAPAARELEETARLTRTLMLKGARSAATGRPLEARALLADIGARRSSALDVLVGHPLLRGA